MIIFTYILDAPAQELLILNYGGCIQSHFAY